MALSVLSKAGFWSGALFSLGQGLASLDLGASDKTTKPQLSYKIGIIIINPARSDCKALRSAIRFPQRHCSHIFIYLYYTLKRTQPFKAEV